MLIVYNICIVSNPYESDKVAQAWEAQRERAQEGCRFSCPIVDCHRTASVSVERIVSVEMLTPEAALVNATVATPDGCNSQVCASEVWATVLSGSFDIMWLNERVPADRFVEQA
jgi:hypothetical protein